MRLHEKDPLSAVIPTLISTSQKSSTKLATLVRELLNVSKIESGQLVLNKTNFNLGTLVEECCTVARLEGMHKLSVEGETALEVFADPERIDQVIVNFISNAIKYGLNSHQIRVVIEKIENSAKVSVIDQGIGIEQEKLPHLFERYYRVHPSGHQYSGLGLGLYISAEIVRLHGGDLGVSSVLGQGSTFWFTIPLS